MRKFNLINWVASHRDAAHFDKDLELFKAKFPDSPILKALEGISPFQKKEFDERMLIELAVVMDPDEILKYRKPEEIDPNAPKSVGEFTALLLDTDVDSLDLKALRWIFKGLEITPEDDSELSLRSSLQRAKESFLRVMEEVRKAGEQAEADRIKKLNDSLLNTEVAELGYKEMQVLKKAFGLKTDDNKADTLFKALCAHKEVLMDQVDVELEKEANELTRKNNILINADVDALDYSNLKDLIALFDLKTVNNKGETFIKALKDHKELLIAEAAGQASEGSGEPDTGDSDAGKPDTGNSDAGKPDAGNTDAGKPDAGNTDAGGAPKKKEAPE